jgi:hypothetical protein
VVRAARGRRERLLTIQPRDGGLALVAVNDVTGARVTVTATSFLRDLTLFADRLDPAATPARYAGPCPPPPGSPPRHGRTTRHTGGS